MRQLTQIFLGLWLVLGLSANLCAQNRDALTVQVGAKSITTNDHLVIYFTLPVSDQQAIYHFPELANFKKLGVSRSKASLFQNGQVVQTQTFSQYYQPSSIGSFTIPAQEVQINGQMVAWDPFVVQVTEGVAEETEEVKESAISDLTLTKNNGAFFLVSTNARNPYVGQGFTIKMSFYVPESNASEMIFDRNDLQIPELIQQLRPRNCWEENFGLQAERVLKVQFRGKKYTEYRFFQASYFSLDNHVIRIPSLTLRVKQVLPGKGLERQLKNNYFKSAPLVIIPKTLPTHPLAGKVPVGEYHLEEGVSKKAIKTGQPITYQASVVGDGNSILWDSKEVESDYFVDFSPISTERAVVPIRDQMIGYKTDVFKIVPEQPGQISMGKYFKWIFFNTKKERFDTLRSSLVLIVKGQPSDRFLQTQEESGGVYQQIETKDSLSVQWNRWINWRQLVNFVILLVITTLLFLFWKASK
jgi:hypothetical protein